MKKAIQFRVLIDHEQDVFRDIEISNDATFLDLHDMIQEAFGFDNSQMASFYESNADWEKGQEITLMEVQEPEEDGEPIWLMQNIRLDEMIFEQGQRLLYVFDFFLMWCFFVEVVKINELSDTVILPRITQRFGESPDQYSKSPDLQFDIEEKDEDDDLEQDEIDELFRMMGEENEPL